MAWSPDSTRLATTSRDGTARIYNAATGELLVAFGLRAASTSVDWCGDLLAFGVGPRLVVLRYSEPAAALSA